MWSETDRVELFEALERDPFAYDFFQAMRRIECLHPDKPRWGRALRPQDEVIRLGQEPSLSFAPATLSAFRRGEGGRPPRLEVRFMGLLGPNGPLPLHLSEYARSRILHSGDETFARFLDVLQHRFLALFYRAWAQAQPTVNLDRPREDRFAAYVGSLLGVGMEALSERDGVSDSAKRFHAGSLSRQVANAEGLAALLGDYFGLPVAIEQYVGHWMRLDEESLCGLGRASLGRDALAGRCVWDRQSKFRIRIGPLRLSEYADILPGGTALPRLLDWVRLRTSGELFWDVRLILRRDEVAPLSLGRGARLGWTSWLGQRQQGGDAEDVVIDAERLMRRRPARATTESQIGPGVAVGASSPQQ